MIVYGLLLLTKSTTIKYSFSAKSKTRAYRLRSFLKSAFSNPVFPRRARVQRALTLRSKGCHSGTDIRHRGFVCVLHSLAFLPIRRCPHCSSAAGFPLYHLLLCSMIQYHYISFSASDFGPSPKGMQILTRRSDFGSLFNWYARPQGPP